MRTLLLTIVLISAASLFGQNSEYIGYKHKPVLIEHRLPNGVRDIGGAMVMDENEVTKYGVGRFSKGRTQMLWLEMVTAEDAQGPTEWEVKDVLTFPAFARNQELFFAAGNGACTINKKEDPVLVVLGQLISRPKGYKVLRAWRIDLRAEKFTSIPVTGIKCIYEEP